MAKGIIWAFTLLVFTATSVFGDDLESRIEAEVDACVYHTARLAKPYLIEKIPKQELYDFVSALRKPGWMEHLIKESRKKDSMQIWKGFAAFCEKHKTGAIKFAKELNLWLGHKRKPAGGIYASKAVGNTLEAKVEREIVEPCMYQMALTFKSSLLQSGDDPAYLWKLAQIRAKHIRKNILPFVRKELAKDTHYYPSESYMFRTFFIRNCLSPKHKKALAKPVVAYLNDLAKKWKREDESYNKNRSLWFKHCHLESAKCEDLSSPDFYQCAGRKSDRCAKLTQDIIRYEKKRDEERERYRQEMSKDERRKSLAEQIGWTKKMLMEEEKLCARKVMDKLREVEGADLKKGERPKRTSDLKYHRRFIKCVRMESASLRFLSTLVQPEIDHYMKSLSPDEQRKEKKVLQPILESIKYWDALNKCIEELRRMKNRPGSDDSENARKRNAQLRQCLRTNAAKDSMETLKRQIHKIHRHFAGTKATWRGIQVAPEVRCSPYVRKHYDYPASIERRIVRRMGNRIYGPYTGRTFSSMRQTDIEHIVATSEAHDSGLCSADETTRKQFARDLDNLTLASPKVNRCSPKGKCGKDAAEWMPEKNKCWFANRIVQVRRKWYLSIDRKEADALEKVLAGCESTDMVFHPAAK